jgi:rubredoxin
MTFQCTSCGWSGEENETTFDLESDKKVCPVCGDNNLEEHNEAD